MGLDDIKHLKIHDKKNLGFFLVVGLFLSGSLIDFAVKSLLIEQYGWVGFVICFPLGIAIACHSLIIALHLKRRFKRIPA
jgi:cell division protein FtsW (lipid II flippase)